MMPGVTRGLVVVRAPEGDAIVPAAHWPDANGDVRELAAVAALAIRKGRTVAQAGANGASRVAVPFGSANARAGAVVLELEKGGGEDARDAIEDLRLGIAWLEVMKKRDAAVERLVAVLEFVGLAVEHERGSAGRTAVATEMATRLGFDRVSLGFSRRGRVSVEALSHSATFDRKANLIRDLSRAMDEACDQDAVILYPEPRGTTPRIVREHQQLARKFGARSACTVPMAVAGKVVGAFTFERATPQPISSDTVQLCEDAVALVGPLLQLRHAHEARTWDRMRDWLTQHAARLFGPHHPTLKLVASTLTLLVAFLVLARGDYRVVADATLEGRVQRAIVAGFDGYIAEAHARAGDLVKAGQILGRLDERDLALEQRKLVGLREQFRKEYREALAGHDRTQVNILSAKLAQAEAELDLTTEQLQRTRLVAPFEGVVVRGDLSQSLGSPVERGEVLFEIAPLDGYRIILKVDERDVSDVAVGASGQLALSAMPGSPLPLTVQKLTPVSVAEDGRNYFRVEARLDGGAESLRPGMEGIAKIDVDRRSLFWIWTHDLADWLRLWVWSWSL